jgi:5-methyltetrahydropteroyltriglutamate--homocysteine methyltransferase
MAEASTPPFRADHVGSLLRPTALKEAREKAQKGEISATALRAIEDRRIRDVVALQEAVGLHSITDGEFRRTSFHADFLEQLDGVGVRERKPVQVGSPDATSSKPFSPRELVVTGKLRHVRPVELENFNFLKSVTTRQPKLTIPSPTMLLRGGRDAVSREAYPDLDAYHNDIVVAYRAEIKALGEGGCTYLQLDDTNLAYLCDAKMREGMRQRGDVPDELLKRYAWLINAAIADRPPGMTVSVHLCRGNFQSTWAAQGGYEPVAEVLFNDLAIDGYFLEYDDARSGDFTPLRFAPKKTNKKIVLGLVSSKVAPLEATDDLKRRIDEAAKFVPIENLCLSPQCGFASHYSGNLITEDVQRRKLERVVEVATNVWGTAH